MAAYPLIPDEDNLIRSAQEGKLDAFSRLYESYFPLVHKRVQYLVPQEDVEDVTQNVFLSTMRSLKGFRMTAQFGTWLRTITNRQIAEYYRRRKKPESTLDERIRCPEDPCSEDEVLVIRQAFRKLPQRYQEILLLRFAEGLQFDEIASSQGQTLEGTKSLFRRAIAALQKQVNGNE
jgi:RNA polymerase sigma-70 factor, ECF subfamily